MDNLVKPRLAFALLLVLGTLWFGGHAQTTQERVRIKAIMGTVKIRMPKSENWRPGRVGMPVRMGSDIRTFMESTCELAFETGSVVRVGENAVVTLTTALKHEGTNATRSSVEVATGEIWANVKKLTTTRSRFRFETPTATAAIRGTRLGIKVGRQETRFDVYEGLVMVKSGGSDKAVPVSKHTRAIVRWDQDDIETIRFTPETARDPSLDQKTADQPPMIDPFVHTDTSGTANDTSSADSSAQGGSETDTVLVPDTSGASAGEDSTGSMEGDSGQAPGEPTDTVAAQPAGSDTAQADTLGPESGAEEGTVQTGLLDAGGTASDSAEVSETSGSSFLRIVYPKAGQRVVNETPVVVTGKTVPGATAYVGQSETPVGSDGYFAGMVPLEPGVNSIPIRVSFQGEEEQMTVGIEYRPELTLDLRNLVDGMRVASAQIELDIALTEGAMFSVNGTEGQSVVQLNPGPNTVRVAAWDRWGKRVEETVKVVYTPRTDFVLNIAAPAENGTVEKPQISVSGSTSPGARVTVNDLEVPVGNKGFFSYLMHIPDEEGAYQLRIVAAYQGSELVEERTVEYEAPAAPLRLTVTSPAEGQKIGTRTLQVMGMSSPQAFVTVNGQPVGMTPQGVFTTAMPVTEHMIGELAIEIAAANDEEELMQTVNVEIDGGSPQINTSTPILVVQEQRREATRSEDLTVQILDRTPEDQLTLSASVNGIGEEIVVDAGAVERIALDEGRNDYTVTARDQAGNVAPLVGGTIYYLPGPLTIELLEPSTASSTVRGLPPLPRGVENPRLEIEVEIEDGIGDVPETIEYVRVRGHGQDVLLTDNHDYTFTGEVELPVGRNVSFTIEAEDIAGNRVSRAITAIVHR